MAKKVFYNRRYKMPGWAQPYAVWAVVAIVTLVTIGFTSFERVNTDAPEALQVRVNGFADGLFYELRESDAGEHAEVISTYAARLKKKHNYTVREVKAANCRVLQIDRVRARAYGLAALFSGNRAEAVYAAMVFLDKLTPNEQSAAISLSILLPQQGCDKNAWIESWAANDLLLPVVVDIADGAGSANEYNRIGHLKNLTLRRYFPEAFLSSAHATWANATGLISHSASPIIRLAVNNKFGNSPEATLAENPLLRHPLVSKADAESLARPAGLYLSANTQLYPGGFTALLVVVWLLALLPFVNALGTFRERIDLGSAATSFVLYALAFLSYLLLFKLSCRFIKGDVAIGALAVVLVPLVFFPVRVLQKTMLRAELNRPGLHLLLQAALTIVCFLNPLTALIGLLVLTAASAFARATLSRKLLRLSVLALIAIVFVAITREPLGSFANFLFLYLPSFESASIVSLLLLCLIGGNLVALLFVPRERI